MAALLHNVIPAANASPGSPRMAAATPTSALLYGHGFAPHSGTMVTTFQRAWALSRERTDVDTEQCARQCDGLVQRRWH
eukprot:4857257-Amphidinium_carterae.1